MKKLRQLALLLVMILSLLISTLSVLSLFPNLASWYFELLDFPRLHYLLLALCLLFIFILIRKNWQWPEWLVVAGLAGVIIIQSTFILPYFLGNKAVPDATSDEITNTNTVGIIIANVLMKNRQADAFLNLVRAKKPDLILTMEVDQWWVDQLQPLRQEYPYTVEYPMNNAYGMALYSRLPLENAQVLFLDDEKIPSIQTKVKMPASRDFLFYGVHPVAPFPSSRYPDGKGEKEVTLVQIGKKIAKDPLPAIVAGDFNDVSWSYTSRMFSTQGQLGNVRLGRGIYNTFSSDSYIKRWPLDHFFVTEDFKLHKLERLPDFHSDHFALYARLVLPK
jgi:endonuclease/exonuclease/phosphatase (EEP) superfamily protein YafD